MNMKAFPNLEYTKIGYLNMISVFGEQCSTNYCRVFQREIEIEVWTPKYNPIQNNLHVTLKWRQIDMNNLVCAAGIRHISLTDETFQNDEKRAVCKW